MSTIEKLNDWPSRIIQGTIIGDPSPPVWLKDAYVTFHSNIVDSKYPCYFGSQAERNGALYYSYIRGTQIDDLPVTLQTFLDVCVNLSRDRNNLVVFFEPDVDPQIHSENRSKFWDTLQYLVDHDPTPHAATYLYEPSEPRWEFPFAGKQFFVVGISPSYRLHRSRNLGTCLIMIFQPREVFKDGLTGKDITSTTRELIRHRALLWDGVETHPDLNTYGLPGNREWTQYFISDDNTGETGRCPLSHGAPGGAPSELEDPPSHRPETERSAQLLGIQRPPRQP